MYSREKRESRKGGEGAVIVQFDATRGGLWPGRPGLATGQVDPANPPEAFSSATLVDNRDELMRSDQLMITLNGSDQDVDGNEEMIGHVELTNHFQPPIVL